MSENRSVFTLKQVVSSIRKTLEERYQSLYWVKAEMHKLNKYPSGHCFPELVQKEDDKIVAQINGSIWKHNFERINKTFEEVVKEPLQEGTTLLMQVRITFHETFGLSLQILDIDPNFTLGELQRERQETLLKLQKEGILNLNQQLDFPLLPKRIAIVSADTSKGLSDFRKVIEHNINGYQFFQYLFPAYLQGDVAIPSIIEQLEKIKKVKHHFDIVVLVRGGGGEVGLSCYNNYELCKAIATFPLPVLTGIGHSTNLTVAELVAFRNAITPTELADFLIGTFFELDLFLQDATKVITTKSKNLFNVSRNQLENSIRYFKSITNNKIGEIKNELLTQQNAIHNKTKFRLLKERENLNQIPNRIRKSWKNIVDGNILKFERIKEKLNRESNLTFKNNIEKIHNLKELLKRNTIQLIDKNKLQIIQNEKHIQLVDPINVLKRGYSITLFNEKSISEENKPKEEEIIKIKTFHFEIDTKVKSIKTNK